MKRKGRGTFTDKERLDWLFRKARGRNPAMEIVYFYDDYNDLTITIKRRSQIDSAM